MTSHFQFAAPLWGKQSSRIHSGNILRNIFETIFRTFSVTFSAIPELIKKNCLSFIRHIFLILLPRTRLGDGVNETT